MYGYWLSVINHWCVGLPLPASFPPPLPLQPRSKKRRPTFRRLLKTSGVKLENKLKNRQMKQQNVAKKQRKEQKKLRQAMKDAAIRTPRPLETYRKRPGEHVLTEAKMSSFPQGRVGLLTWIVLFIIKIKVFVMWQSVDRWAIEGSPPKIIKMFPVVCKMDFMTHNALLVCHADRGGGRGGGVYGDSAFRHAGRWRSEQHGLFYQQRPVIMVTPIHTPSSCSPGDTHTDRGVFVCFCRVSQRPRAQWEEAELRGGAKLWEDSPKDAKDRGEGGCPPAANQGQVGHHPTESRER